LIEKDVNASEKIFFKYFFPTHSQSFSNQTLRCAVKTATPRYAFQTMLDACKTRHDSKRQNQGRKKSEKDFGKRKKDEKIAFSGQKIEFFQTFFENLRQQREIFKEEGVDQERRTG
jgi:hypothetical protein